ncbi:hsp70 nucleotide exchange factor [Grosmannia clavigera kw1407]|uniref:Hsp70 nucleotide exchange factor n=1 Tax=Grosmannia clavigera (strain kw1407 / UAMH 11150) TaxID=655863 RepID=F0XRF5_GROCL|nr:hsp70 nucleotide exchange factor [Grosmannia clavigera kw1407]EFW99986.1 hsp70 nucleotide exchange factor [Grosmannia clavigera kw1407]
MDKGLNELLKWSIENASTTANDPPAGPPTNRGLNTDAINALLGGPSDADLMKASMEVITSTDPDLTLDDKMVAFDNFEQLVESLDNANLLSNLALWPPLLAVLGNDDLPADLRRMAAWCVGTAVQNNKPSQESLVAHGGIPALVRLATATAEPAAVRRKAVYALSSACRNFQPAMDVCVEALVSDGRLQQPAKPVDAQNMDAVDEIMDSLKSEFMSTSATAAAA